MKNRRRTEEEQMKNRRNRILHERKFENASTRTRTSL